MESIDQNLVAIIMAGGVGTRFWPLSTHERPKQFIQLFDDRSLLQKSYDRVAGIVPDERVIVLTNWQFTPLVHEQLPNLPDHNIIGEPKRKDTAASVDSIEHFHVISFKEKPNAEVASQYLESGRYLWNSGMFVWTTDAIFSELTEGIHAKVIWCNRAFTQKHNICYEVDVEYFS